jgi:flagellar hook protein FlgE
VALPEELTPPEELAPPEEPIPSNAYGTAWSMKKEAKGLYSVHRTASYAGEDHDYAFIRRTLVDSLGNKHDVEMNIRQLATYSYLEIASASDSAYPKINIYFRDGNGTFSTGSRDSTGLSTAFDETAKQLVITFTDTGAQLTLDLSDVQQTRGADHPRLNSGETFSWTFPPIVFRDGIYRALQGRYTAINALSERWIAYLRIERSEDGLLTGTFELAGAGVEADLRFDEEGRISGYKFTKNASSTRDPSVGIEYTGSIVKGMYRSSIYGPISADLSSVQALYTPGPPELEEVVEESEEADPSLPPATSVTAGNTSEGNVATAPLSSSSLSIDENGVLSRLKDNGDWEPLYLLACAQFAAMNAAEERNGVYYATPASGPLKTGVSGKEGMGTITSGTLERSTTDLAHELSEMIRAQHAYAANTKVLSTIEDMLEELERL